MRRVCRGARMRCSAWGFLKARAGHRITECDWQLTPLLTLRTPIGMGWWRSDRDRRPHAAGTSPSRSLSGVPRAGMEVPSFTADAGHWHVDARCGNRGAAILLALWRYRRSEETGLVMCRPFSRRASRPSAFLTYRRSSCFRQCGCRASLRSSARPLLPPRSSLERWL